MPRDCTAALIETGCGIAMPVRVQAGVPGRGAPLVLHLHGGAFRGGASEGGAAEGHGIVAALLADAGAVVVSACYPAGNGHPFPEALEATYAVLQRLHADRARWAGRASKLFVAGEEAGGNLAAALAMVARDRRGPPLAGQILLSPMLDPGMATCSIRSAEAGPVGCKWADGWHAYLGCPDKAAHPYAAPGGATRLAGLAPALVLTAQDDPMRDESLGYASRLRASGVAVQVHTIPAPTLWPEALAQPAPPAPDWGQAVHAAFLDFFATTTRAAHPGRVAL